MPSAFESLKERDARSVCSTYGRYPLAVSRAEGSRLYDLDGREYVDLLAGIAVTSLGHSHPEILQTIADQAPKLMHVSNLFYQEEYVSLAEALKSTCAAGKVFFCNSGAEANEAAIKLARRYMQVIKGRDASEILTLEGSFHGRTLACVAATGQEKFKVGFSPMPGGFRSVPFADLNALENAIGPQTAAVLLEVIQGEGGVRPCPHDYLQGVQDLCRKKDVLLLVDEVQTGLCRTGHFWAHQGAGITPDIFTSAKALANGLPMGAMLATDEVAQGFAPGAHAATFGGNALCAAVATKVIEIMRRDKLDQRAIEMEQHVRGLVSDIARDMPGRIDYVRGSGLMLGIVLTAPGLEVWKGLMERGFVCNLTQDRVLRLLPPLTIEVEHLEAFAKALRESLAATA